MSEPGLAAVLKLGSQPMLQNTPLVSNPQPAHVGGDSFHLPGRPPPWLKMLFKQPDENLFNKTPTLPSCTQGTAHCFGHVRALKLFQGDGGLGEISHTGVPTWRVVPGKVQQGGKPQTAEHPIEHHRDKWPLSTI